ncbi:MAG TPA: ATP-dependent zinc metalloprotease FtsH [Candidatus Krumholzibacteria bacterium]|nr:ATP-dependent zinc metalloprotease FtsH [Candidatus Krumholzibacteria bacterium]
MADNPRGNPRRPRPRSPLGLPGSPRRRPVRHLAFWLVLLMVLLLSFQHYYYGKPRHETVTYSEFLQEVEAGNIRKLTFMEKEIEGELVREKPLSQAASARTLSHFRTSIPFDDPDLLRRVAERNPDAVIDAKRPQANWLGILASGLPFLLLIVFWLFLMRQMQGGGNRAFSFGKSRAKLLEGDRPKVTFQDVAGCEEAKQELQEIVEFLRDPKKFQRLGGRIPKGALLLGPPGTGKTLLARAVAGEASVSFFSMSGSDFVEMFVGVGASRVRDLFEQGKKNAPCIVFIDEIDAVGRHRGAGLGGGHDEREQTLNQLLVEMDGFESNDGVILIAATNRPDVLDPALLRPGRFDRQIVVDMPDVRGREGILKVHSRNIPMAEGVDLMRIARGTPGFSGADLANLVNEAALLAARRNVDRVTHFDLEQAKDKVIMGPERRSRVMSEDTRRMVAYHEAGHAIVAHNLPHADPVHKITIIPRGRTGGATFTLPLDDRDEVSREWVLDMVTMAMGGRVAEKLILNRLGSGAQSDIAQATKHVRRMVTRWGMSEKLGPVAYGEPEELVFLGKDFSHRRDFSEATAERIDEEVSSIIQQCYQRAERILVEHMDQLHLLAKTLLERETLDGDEMRKLLIGEELPPIDEKNRNGSAPRGDANADPTATSPTSDAITPAPGSEATPELGQAAVSTQNPPEPKPAKPDAGGLFGTPS